MLTMTFLGVGSAFAKRNYQSNVLVEAWRNSPDSQAVPDETLLIDFGSTGPLALHSLMRKPGFDYLNHQGAVDYTAIHRVFITHLHSDHIGGLEEMASKNAYSCGERHHRHSSEEIKPSFKPQIISSSSVLANLWEHSLQGGLGVRAGRQACMRDYFSTLALDPQDPEWNYFDMLWRYRFRVFATDHLQVSRKYDWPSYGLFIEDAQTGDAVLYTGDTRFDYPAYAEMMERARICFHDAQLMDEPSPVHALLSELRTLPEPIRRKTYLYHYGDDWDGGTFDDVNGNTFAGFAQPSRRYRVLG